LIELGNDTLTGNDMKQINKELDEEERQEKVKIQQQLLQQQFKQRATKQ
jgi:hypothetical protein